MKVLPNTFNGQCEACCLLVLTVRCYQQQLVCFLPAVHVGQQWAQLVTNEGLWEWRKELKQLHFAALSSANQGSPEWRKGKMSHCWAHYRNIYVCVCSTLNPYAPAAVERATKCLLLSNHLHIIQCSFIVCVCLCWLYMLCKEDKNATFTSKLNGTNPVLEARTLWLVLNFTRPPFWRF